MADLINRIVKALLAIVRARLAYLAGKRGQEVRQHEQSEQREEAADEARERVRGMDADARRQRLRDDWSE